MRRNLTDWLRAKPVSTKGLCYAVLAYVALTVVYTYPAVLHLGDRIIGDSSGHALLSLWDLWWVKHATLTPGLQVFRTNHLFYPAGVSLYFHTLVPLYGFLSIPIQLALGLVVAHNLIILTSFVVGGVTSFLLVRHVVRDDWGAFVAGAAFTFGSYHVARAMGHLNLVLIEWLPLYTILLLKSTDSRWFSVLAGLCLSLILLVDLHYLFYCTLLTGWFAIYRLWQVRADRQHVVRWMAWLGIVAVSFSLPSLPVLIPMAREAISSPEIHPDSNQVLYYSADLLSYLVPSQYQFLYGAKFDGIRNQLSQGPYESHNFLGYTCLLLGVVGATTSCSRRKRLSVFWVGTVLIFWVLSLGPVLHVGGRTEFTEFRASVLLPYALLYNLPFVGISRVVGRMSIMVLMGLVVLSGFGISEMSSRVEGARLGPFSAKVVLSCLAVGLVLFENLPGPFVRGVPVVPSFYKSLASDSGAYAVLDLPTPWRNGSVEFYQFYQTVHEKKLRGGYHSRVPSASLEEVWSVAELAAERVEPTPRSSHFLEPLAGLFRYVVLHKNRGGPVDQLASALSSIPPCYEDESVRVYCPQGFQHSADFVLGGKIGLGGYELSRQTFRPGDRVLLTLFWECLKTPEENYSVFTHLVDSRERLVSQHDCYPQNGENPTTRWAAGQWIWDEHELTIPQAVSPGIYRLSTGLYNPDTGQRLAAFSGEGERVPEDRILLGTITVVE